jgi:hypothetical protein
MTVACELYLLYITCISYLQFYKRIFEISGCVFSIHFSKRRCPMHILWTGLKCHIWPTLVFSVLPWLTIATTSVDAGQTVPSLVTNQIPRETTKGT